MRVGILNLDALIPMYQDGLRYLSHSLVQRGVEVIHLGCDQSLNRCVIINSQSTVVDPDKLEDLKSQVCSQCLKSQSLHPHMAGLRVSPADRLSPQQLEFLNRIRERLAQNASGEAILDQTYDEIEICRLAFFEFSMVGKVAENSLLNETEVRRFLQHVEDSLRLMNFFRRAGEQFYFDKIVYVNGNYTPNTLAREVLKDRCRSFISFEFQFSSHGLLNRIFFERDRIPVQPRWDSVTRVEQNYHQRESDAKTALRSFRNRFVGNDFNSYTRPTPCDDQYRFGAFRKKYSKVISYFSCSSDELRAHTVTHGTKLDQTFFASQIELIESILKNASDDTGYVIRVHPRLAPNKRDGATSREIQEMDQVVKAVRDRPNFLVVPAQSPFSSYELMTNSDLVVVSWSTVGLESLIAGKPAFVLFPQNCVYPAAELCKQPKDRLEFAEVIRGRRDISNYKLNDTQIIRWISIVYSSLSRPAPFPRGQGNALAVRLFGRFFRLVQRSKVSLGAYVWLSSFLFRDAIDCLFLERREVRFPPASPVEIERSLTRLNEFRAEMNTLFLFR